MIIILSILIVIFDQLSKEYFSNTLSLGQTYPIIENIFHLTLVHNTGIAFGLLKESAQIVIIGVIIVCLFIFIWLRKEIEAYLRNPSLSNRMLVANKAAVIFIIGGAVSNMIDRLRFGYVIDFLDFRIWPVFNFADSFITIGAVILVINFFIIEKIRLKK